MALCVLKWISETNLQSEGNSISRWSMNHDSELPAKAHNELRLKLSGSTEIEEKILLVMTQKISAVSSNAAGFARAVMVSEELSSELQKMVQLCMVTNDIGQYELWRRVKCFKCRWIRFGGNFMSLEALLCQWFYFAITLIITWQRNGPGKQSGLQKLIYRSSETIKCTEGGRSLW